MPKTSKVVVCGLAGTGKTSILEQLIYGNYKPEMVYCPTIEDIYVAQIETNRGTKEKVRFYDTAGLNEQKSEPPRHLFSVCDGVILVYNITQPSSFAKLDAVKIEIDKLKEKKEIVIIALGNKTDLNSERKVERSTADVWANKEKIRVFEVTATDRRTLTEPFVFLASKLTQPPTKSTFPQDLVTKITRKGDSKNDKNSSDC